MKAVSNYLTWSSSNSKKEAKNDEMIELVNVKFNEANQPAMNGKEFTAEILSTEKSLLQLLKKVKSDPKMMEKALDGLDPNHPLHALLSEDLTSSQILLSDEKKADEWLEKVKTEDVNLPKKKAPWRYYHIVTLPVKYSWKGVKCIHKGYRFCSELIVPLAVGAIVIQSPWLPILKMLLHKIL